MAVLAILAAIALPAINGARRSGMRSACKARIERIAAAIEQYAATFGDFPPTRLAEIGVQRSNGINEGIETLLRCLTTRREGGPFLEPDADELGNTDEDSLRGEDPVASALGTAALLEFVDPWGQPLFYFHNRDYRGGRRIERYLIGDMEARVRPRPDPETGLYPAPVSFLIWSAGPDGKDDGGGGDDVCSWR